MGKMPIGACIGLLLAVGGCAGSAEGNDPVDVVETNAALESGSAGVARGLAGSSLSADVVAEIEQAPSILEPTLNLAGVAATVHSSGRIDRTNPFFQNLGVNGRTCETCHDSRSAWTTSATLMSLLFEFTGGTHPLFVSLH